MSFASRGASATVQLPWGQLALVGLGAFCVANPDKFFESLAVGARILQSSNNNSSSNGSSPSQPIVIHHTAQPTTTVSRSKTGYVIQLVLGAGFCWGSYVVLVTVLPEAAKGMLPVNRTLFNHAVTSLGKAVINLKDTLMVQINALCDKQDDLSDKQDATHTEVLNVKTNVQDIRGDLGLLQEALDLCHSSLSENERRTTYISRGVQLLTRGVSTILPEDENLLHELVQFNMAGDEFNAATPLQQQRLQETINAIHEVQNNNNGTTTNPNNRTFLHNSTSNNNNNDTSDPENEVPSTPEDVAQSVAPVELLLSEITGFKRMTSQ